MVNFLLKMPSKQKNGPSSRIPCLIVIKFGIARGREFQCTICPNIGWDIMYRLRRCILGTHIYIYARLGKNKETWDFENFLKVVHVYVGFHV